MTPGLYVALLTALLAGLNTVILTLMMFILKDLARRITRLENIRINEGVAHA